MSHLVIQHPGKLLHQPEAVYTLDGFGDSDCFCTNNYTIACGLQTRIQNKRMQMLPRHPLELRLEPASSHPNDIEPSITCWPFSTSNPQSLQDGQAWGSLARKTERNSQGHALLQNLCCLLLLSQL